jgi:hypothetical protein
MAESDNSDADTTDGNCKAVRAAGRRKKSSAVVLLTYTAITLLSVAFLPQPPMAAGIQLYTNTFSVKLHGPNSDGGNSGGHVDEEVAHQVAKRAGNGFENVGKVCDHNNIDVQNILYNIE